jgi:hypothetical protein
MKEFRTEINLTPSSAQMNLKHGILTQGSCFSDAIGTRLRTFKVNTLVNPFGVIYNPDSIHNILLAAVFNEPVAEHTFVHRQDVHYNYNVHSAFSDLSKTALSSRLTDAIGSAHYFIKNLDWLLITYGTAWVYERKDTGEIVANCHKLPADFFTKSLMTQSEISASFSTFYKSLKRLNPKVKIILTVSPVRHLKDTLELNSVSKSMLRLACHELATSFKDVDYFPAYELIMDDLRDYRFYKADLLHPTAEAEEYIWEKFLGRYADADTLQFIARWKEILTAVHHRPFHPHSSGHQQFLKQTLKKLEELKSRVNVEEEASFIRKQIL